MRTNPLKMPISYGISEKNGATRIDDIFLRISGHLYGKFMEQICLKLRSIILLRFALLTFWFVYMRTLTPLIVMIS